MKRAIGWGALAFAVFMSVAIALYFNDGIGGDAGELLGVVYGALAGYGAVAVGMVAYLSGPEYRR